MQTILSSVNFRMAKRTLKNVKLRTIGSFARVYALQHIDIAKQRRDGRLKPTSMHVETTTYCTRPCNGCYIPLEERNDRRVMELDTARSAVRMGKKAGIRVYNFIGGEPMTEATLPLVDTIVRENPDVSFYCCTNASMLSKKNEMLEPLVSRHNMSFGLSIDGFEETNDSLRGKGSFRMVGEAAEFLFSRGCFFGAVPTIRPENRAEATSDGFLEFLVKSGFSYVFYSLSQPSLGIEFQRLAAKAKSMPIFLYCNELGASGELSASWRTRIVYVAKDGSFLNDRRERIKIPVDSAGFASVSEHGEWQKKFR